MVLKNNSKRYERRIKELFAENEQLKKQIREKDKNNSLSGDKSTSMALTYGIIFHNINDCVAIYKAVDEGKDFIIYDINPAAERTDKVKREEILGKRIEEVFSGAREYGLIEVLERVWKTGMAELHPRKLYKDTRTSGWRQNYIFSIPNEGLVVSIYEDVTEREKIKEEILSISKFAEEDPYPVMRVSPDLTLLYANPGSKILLSYWKIGEGEKIPSKDYEITDSLNSCTQKFADVIKLALDKGKHSLLEVTCNDIIYSLVIAPVKDGNYVNIYGRDITFRKKIEQALKKANRMYAFISQINQTIIRTNDETELFKRICEVAIEYGKFNFAWVGKADYENKRIIPITYSGGKEEWDFLSKITIPINERSGIETGPAVKAVKEDKVIISNNIPEDPARYTLENNILTEKYFSASAFPFYKDEKKAYGMLEVFTYEKEFFDKDEIKMLDEMSMDISFALKQIKLSNEAEKLKVAEKAKSESQSRILEEMPAGVITCDTEGNIKFVNKKMLEMLGSQSAEATKSINLLNFAPLKVIGFTDAIKSCIESRSTKVLETYYTSKWGKRSFYQCHFLPLENAPRAISTILIMAADLTEQKNLENILKESEERFRQITEVAPYPISIFESTHKYIYLNPKFTELFGYTLNDIPTREKWFELAYPNREYRDYVIKEWSSNLKTNKIKTLKNFNVTCKNGSVKNVVFSSYTLEKGRTLQYCFDLSDLPR